MVTGTHLSWHLQCCWSHLSLNFVINVSTYLLINSTLFHYLYLLNNLRNNCAIYTAYMMMKFVHTKHGVHWRYGLYAPSTSTLRSSLYVPNMVYISYITNMAITSVSTKHPARFMQQTMVHKSLYALQLHLVV
jgi:hypothetical protein